MWVLCALDGSNLTTRRRRLSSSQKKGKEEFKLILKKDATAFRKVGHALLGVGCLLGMLDNGDPRMGTNRSRCQKKIRVYYEEEDDRKQITGFQVGTGFRSKFRRRSGG